MPHSYGLKSLPKNSRIQVIASGREGYVSTDGDDLYAVNFFQDMMRMMMTMLIVCAGSSGREI